MLWPRLKKNSTNSRDEQDLIRRLSLCSSREARACLSLEQALKLNCLPLSLSRINNQEILTVASAEKDAQQKQALSFSTGKNIKIVFTPIDTLERAIYVAYNADQENLKQKIAPLASLEATRHIPNATPEFRPESSEIGRGLAALIDYAVSKSASDLHLVPKSTGSYVKLRIGGKLMESSNPLCPLAIHKQLLSRLKVLAKLDITVSHPQESVLTFPIGSSNLSARLSIMPTIHGERAVLRFVGQDHQILELSQLNLPSRCLDFIETFLLQREGSLIVAGPTGAGKTSTLYAVLSALSEQNLNCVSIEDPVEVQLKDISQTSLPKNLSYAAALRALLRQDPDAILVGEIRDLESAQTAIQSALTGHLVLSSVHARSVLEIGLRFKHFEIDTYSLAQALSLLVCQRLLPRLCEACKVFDLISSNQEDAQIYRPHGCSHCDYSGYHGSVPICEALQIDSALAQVIRQGEFHKFQASLLETTYDARYLSLIESARCALRTGQIGLSQFRSLCEQTR